MFIWLHVAEITFLSVATPALFLIAGFTARTKPQTFLLMPVVKPVEHVSISEVETKRIKSVK